MVKIQYAYTAPIAALYIDEDRFIIYDAQGERLRTYSLSGKKMHKGDIITARKSATAGYTFFKLINAEETPEGTLVGNPTILQIWPEEENGAQPDDEWTQWMERALVQHYVTDVDAIILRDAMILAPYSPTMDAFVLPVPLIEADANTNIVKYPSSTNIEPHLIAQGERVVALQNHPANDTCFYAVTQRDKTLTVYRVECLDDPDGAKSLQVKKIAKMMDPDTRTIVKAHYNVLANTLVTLEKSSAVEGPHTESIARDLCIYNFNNAQMRRTLTALTKPHVLLYDPLTHSAHIAQGNRSAILTAMDGFYGKDYVSADRRVLECLVFPVPNEQEAVTSVLVIELLDQTPIDTIAHLADYPLPEYA